MKVKKCVFPVAGLGTRFLPVTKEIAKEMLPLGLGHAVLCAEPVCNNDFFGIALPDDVFINDVPVLS